MALLLTRADVESALTMEDAITGVEEAFRQHQLGTTQLPLRTPIRIPEHKGLILFMPAFIGGMDALGIKVVSVHPDNPSKHGLPTILATILLHDPATGKLLAIMDGGFLTAMRTGAVSGVATKYLARPDSKVVGLFGAGIQARTQLMAVCAVRPVTEALVYDQVPDAADRFCNEMGPKLGIAARPVTSPRDAVEGCDIIVAATTSKTPVFDGDWLNPGMHINGVGSHSLDARELDSKTIRRSRVVVDLRSAALAEAGDIVIPINNGEITAERLYAELGEIITGKPGREDPDEITIFKSVGLAIQDVSTATKVYQLAREKGIGQEIPL
jgi:ornithine cyclodeaminase/alanine dehydrogenase